MCKAKYVKFLSYKFVIYLQNKLLISAKSQSNQEGEKKPQEIFEEVTEEGLLPNGDVPLG